MHLETVIFFLLRLHADSAMFSAQHRLQIQNIYWHSFSFPGDQLCHVLSRDPKKHMNFVVDMHLFSAPTPIEI